MRKFSDFVVQYRVLVVLVTLGVTALLGYHLKDLRIDSDILNYLPDYISYHQHKLHQDP